MFITNSFKSQLRDQQLIYFFNELCPSAELVIKADDDIFLNPFVLIRNLELFILRFPEPQINGTYRENGALIKNYKGTIEILGNIIRNAAPKENPFDKYFVPESISQSMIDSQSCFNQ